MTCLPVGRSEGGQERVDIDVGQFLAPIEGDQVNGQADEFGTGPVMGHIPHLAIRFAPGRLFLAPGEQRRGMIGKGVKQCGRFGPIALPEPGMPVKRGKVPHHIRCFFHPIELDCGSYLITELRLARRRAIPANPQVANQKRAMDEGSGMELTSRSSKVTRSPAPIDT